LPWGETTQGALSRLVRHGFEIRSIIDLGASDGKWSRMAVSFFPEARILGIEPLTEREPDLRAMRSEYKTFSYNICAAGNQDQGMAVLNVTPELDGSYIGAGPGARQVPLRTVDSLVAQSRMVGPFLMKFDTHGYELQILEGASNTLRDTPVIIMEMLNFGGLRFPELLMRLDELGYRPLDAVDVVRTPTNQVLWQFDFVLVRKDHPLLRDAAFS
jgi:FkbM family methyltransferase